MTSPSLSEVALAAACLAALAWYVYPSTRLLLSPRKQLTRRYVEVPLAGSALFGAVLGIGLMTLITTPLVWSGALAVVASGSFAVGLVYGLGFAVGRTLQLLVLRTRASERAGEIAIQVAARRQRYHLAGVLVAICLAGIVVVHRSVSQFS